MNDLHIEGNEGELSSESSEDEDESAEEPYATSTEVLRMVNGTLRSTGRHNPQRKPSWLDAWHTFVSKCRLAQTLLFLELFAGVAKLAKHFPPFPVSCKPIG